MTYQTEIADTETCVSAVRTSGDCAEARSRIFSQPPTARSTSRKFQNNPQHVRVLANEMLAGQLGQFLAYPSQQLRSLTFLST